MNELKLEQGCWYWAKYREDLEYTSYGNIKGSWVRALWTDGHFRTERGNWHRGDFDTAIPCDEFGWIDAKTNPPPDGVNEIFCAEIDQYNEVGYNYVYRWDSSDTWRTNNGWTLQDFTHWQPINKPERMET